MKLWRQLLVAPGKKDPAVRNLGLDQQKFLRKYLGMINELSIDRGSPLPDEQEIIGDLKDPMATRAAPYERPALDLGPQYRDDIKKNDDTRMTAKQAWRLLKENYNIDVGYTTVKRYVRKEFHREKHHVTVRMRTPAKR